MTKSALDPTGCQLGEFPDPLPDIIPFGGISLLAGAPNVGKTALLAWIARCFRDRALLFGHQPNALPAIGIINADRGWAKGAGGWFRRVGFADIRVYSMSDDRFFDRKRLRRRFDRSSLLIEFIDKLQLPPGSLVLVDPIGMFLGGNLNDYDTCAVACHEIRFALEQRGLTLLGTAHSSKIKADKRERYLRLQDQILGSTAIFGFTDTQMYLASPEETGEPYYTFVWHPHMAKVELHMLSRDEQGLFVPYDGADQGNCARVLALFPEDGSEVQLQVLVELAEAIPLSRATLKLVLAVLIERERVDNPQRGIYCGILLH